MAPGGDPASSVTSIPEMDPVPILTSEQYRFLRFALDLAASLTTGEGGQMHHRGGHCQAAGSPRVTAALALFEALAPSANGTASLDGGQHVSGRLIGAGRARPDSEDRKSVV